MGNKRVASLAKREQAMAEKEAAFAKKVLEATFAKKDEAKDAPEKMEEDKDNPEKMKPLSKRKLPKVHLTKWKRIKTILKK